MDYISLYHAVDEVNMLMALIFYFILIATEINIPVKSPAITKT